MKSGTIAAISTGEAVSAIGLIRLSGPQAIAIADKIFKGASLKEMPSHTVHYGKIVEETGREIDDVIVTIFIAPKSYTSEDVVEISCHGSPYILKEIMS